MTYSTSFKPLISSTTHYATSNKTNAFWYIQYKTLGLFHLNVLTQHLSLGLPTRNFLLLCEILSNKETVKRWREKPTRFKHWKITRCIFNNIFWTIFIWFEINILSQSILNTFIRSLNIIQGLQIMIRKYQILKIPYISWESNVTLQTLDFFSIWHCTRLLIIDFNLNLEYNTDSFYFIKICDCKWILTGSLRFLSGVIFSATVIRQKKFRISAFEFSDYFGNEGA